MKIDSIAVKTSVKLAEVVSPVLTALLSATLLAATAQAQTTATIPSRVDPSSTQIESTALRDAFVARIRAAGLTCPLPVPTIVVEDVPSFGQYRPETNVVRTSDWDLLSAQERAMFIRLAGPGKNESDAHTLFDVAHQWIFIHELGHWWQACSGGTREDRITKSNTVQTALLSLIGVR